MEISWGHSYETIPFSPTKVEGFSKILFSYERNCLLSEKLLGVVSSPLCGRWVYFVGFSRQNIPKGTCLQFVFLVNVSVCIYKGYNDECPARKYGCQHVHYCVNLPDGGHRCMCHHGYNLASNGRDCEGVIPRLNLKFMRFIFISPEPSPRPLISCFKGTDFLFSC